MASISPAFCVVVNLFPGSPMVCVIVLWQGNVFLKMQYNRTKKKTYPRTQSGFLAHELNCTRCYRTNLLAEDFFFFGVQRTLPKSPGNFFHVKGFTNFPKTRSKVPNHNWIKIDHFPQSFLKLASKTSETFNAILPDSNVMHWHLFSK